MLNEANRFIAISWERYAGQPKPSHPICTNWHERGLYSRGIQSHETMKAMKTITAATASAKTASSQKEAR